MILLRKNSAAKQRDWIQGRCIVGANYVQFDK